MKVFILEDLPDRQEAFKEKFKDHELIMTDSVDGGKLALMENDFDLICLDHDLEGKAYVDSSYYNTGYTLAKFIAERGITCEIIIQSLNPHGAKKCKKYYHKQKGFLDIGQNLWRKKNEKECKDLFSFTEKIWVSFIWWHKYYLGLLQRRNARILC